jgi:diacylglycerol kinase (ATP)
VPRNGNGPHTSETVPDADQGDEDHAVRVTIVHNPDSGEGSVTESDLRTMAAANGYEALYVSTADPRSVTQALAVPTDLVVAAGGDGTVREVGHHLLGRDVPLAILPMGTANNLGTTLGLLGAPASLIAGWATGRRERLDVVLVSGSCGPRLALEGVGIGPVASTIAALSQLTDREARADHVQDELRRDMKVLREIVADCPARPCQVTLDHRDLSGSYLAIEAMNIRSVGPNVELAPDADPFDGQFDVVLIAEDQRARLRDYLTAKLDGIDNPPWLPSHRGRELHIRWNGSRVHIDDEIWPDERDAAHGLCWPGPVDLDLRMSADPLLVLVPRR